MHANTYTIATAIPKGGSGKTTITANTAGALATQNIQTLVVDLDPQGHLTEGLGNEAAYDADGITIRDGLTESNVSFASIGRTAGEDDIGLIPAHASMLSRPRLENVVGQDADTTAGAVRALSTIIDESGADVCIIDCPPSPGALTDVGLLTAQRMLIPAKASGTSMRALELLLSKKRALETEFDTDTIQPIGVAANEVRHSGVSDDLLQWLDETFADSIPVWELRKRVALERAWLNGKTIFTHDEDCEHAETVFSEIAEHIEGHL